MTKTKRAAKKATSTSTTTDFKSATANDTKRTPRVRRTKHNNEPVAATKPAKAAKAPKAPAPKLTPEQVSANRKEGLRLFALAGRPKHGEFRRVFGPKGAQMTWVQRAAAIGVATAEEAAKQFQSVLAKKA